MKPVLSSMKDALKILASSKRRSLNSSAIGNDHQKERSQEVDGDSRSKLASLVPSRFRVANASGTKARQPDGKLSWLTVSNGPGRPASPYFDAAYYLKLNPDVAKANTPAFDHFTAYGEAEGRSPNVLFDPTFYLDAASLEAPANVVHPHLHYLTFGVREGVAPRQMLEPLFAVARAAGSDCAAGFDRLLEAVQPWTRQFDIASVDLLLGLYHPLIYDGGGTLPADADPFQRFVHFLSAGAAASRDPGPLFNSEVYRHAVEVAGGAVPAGTTPLRHFLTTGVKQRIVPTNLFSEAHYRDTYQDVGQSALWGFDHFVRAGLYEGRRAEGRGLGIPLDFYPHSALRAWAGFWATDCSKAEDLITPSPNPVFKTDLDEKQLTFLKALFSPAHYRRDLKSKNKNLDDEMLFEHFLTHGLPRGCAPSPFFQPELIEQQYPTTGALPPPALVRWLTSANRSYILPTVRFDPAFYVSAHADLKGLAPTSLFKHFVQARIAEKRVCCALFDPQWYGRSADLQAELKSVLPYEHYLTFGVREGVAPRQMLEPLFAVARAAGSDCAAGFDRLLEAVQPWTRQFDIASVDLLLGLYHPLIYDGGGTLPADADPFQRFVHFLSAGAAAGRDPGPLFNSEVYRHAVEVAGGAVPAGTTPLRHFLTTGVKQRIVPTNLFSEAHYRDTYQDVGQSALWGFDHFVRAGLYEGRRAEGRGLGLNLARHPRRLQPKDVNLESYHNWEAFYCANGYSIAGSADEAAMEYANRRLQRIVSSETVKRMIDRANKLEPTIGGFEAISSALLPPYHDDREEIRRAIERKIPAKVFGSIICIPWLRTGGADLVACLVARVLQELRPDEPVLLLQTDHSTVERADWVPAGIDRVDISDLLAGVNRSEAEYILYVVLMNRRPRRVINVNSHCAWRLLERYGNRLGSVMELYSYLFCWDQDDAGRNVGYPNEFFASTVGVVTRMFFDTDFLRKVLTRIYALPPDLAVKLVTLHSPSREVAKPALAAASGAATAKSRPRPLVLWSGRLDRQKRFDLVQNIAIALSDIDFACWGRALLDKPPDHARSPANLILKESFRSFDDLPLWNSDLWLYTSAWDGLPTTLIELGQRGVPIVASAVGGVPELIDESTGWLVPEHAGVDAYVAAIRDALARPEERIKRARKLVERTEGNYSRAKFMSEFGAVLSMEQTR